MSTFDDRERGYENRFAHEQETEFKMRAKRDKKIGLWAAEKMHLNDDDADDYASEVVDSDVGGNYETVLAKVLHDLRDAGVDVSEEEVKTEMDRLLNLVREESR
jgi:hypothetical protein